MNSGNDDPCEARRAWCAWSFFILHPSSFILDRSLFRRQAILLEVNSDCRRVRFRGFSLSLWVSGERIQWGDTVDVRKVGLILGDDDRDAFTQHEGGYLAVKILLSSHLTTHA